MLAWCQGDHQLNLTSWYPSGLADECDLWEAGALYGRWLL